MLAAAAPLLAQVLRLPSILMLLALGFGAGVIDALDPNALLGETLISTIVSIAVGIILFDAGLGLNFSRLSGSVARVYRRLVTLGILVTWAVADGGRAYLLLISRVSLVLGAVLVSPPDGGRRCSDFIRPSKEVNSVLSGALRRPDRRDAGVVVFNAVIPGKRRPLFFMVVSWRWSSARTCCAMTRRPDHRPGHGRDPRQQATLGGARGAEIQMAKVDPAPGARRIAP